MLKIPSIPLVLCSALLAQQGPKLPRAIDESPVCKLSPAIDQAVLPATAAPLDQSLPAIATDSSRPIPPASALMELHLPGILYDSPGNGDMWAMAAQWKAGFSPNGVCFVPFYGSDAPRNRPVDFQVIGATVGGQPIAAAGLGVERDGDRIAIAREGLVEQYLITPAGIEQQFVFEHLPVRGELTLAMRVTGDHQVAADNGGFQFTCELGSFHYGAPVALDAKGRSIPMTARLDGDVLQLVVPAAFVQRAQLPLVIDPLIGGVLTLATSSNRYGATDLAYDGSLARYVACYERIWSALDSDVLAMRLDSNLQPFGSAFAIDLTTTSWRRCRIANLNAYDKFLIVAESQAPPVALGAPPSIIAIAGRVYHAGTNVLGNAIDIERGDRDCIRPDVGGDPSTTVPTFFTVVFERRYTATDGDIMMRQVTEAGNLRGSSMTTIDSTSARHEGPVISRSNGFGPFTQQSWLVVYHNRPGNGQARVEGRYISWDGQLGAALATTAWWSTGPNVSLSVSSPTLNSLGRRYVIVDGWQDIATSRMQLSARAVDATGNQLVGRTLLTTSNGSFGEPVVETDGVRFAIGFTQDYSPNGCEVFLGTYDLVQANNQLGFVARELINPGNSNSTEVGLALCSRYTGGAVDRDTEYGVLFGSYLGGNSQTLKAARYLGHLPSVGLSIRPTGCGLGGLQVTSDTHLGVLGSTNTATVDPVNGLVGWVLGLPTSLAITGCSACRQGSSALVTTIGAQTQLQVPYNTGLVGITFAMQAFAFGPGSCLGSLAFSDTADLRIR